VENRRAVSLSVASTEGVIGECPTASLAASILKDNGVPGMAAVIADRERTVWTAGLGLADVAARTPATPDTLFRVASISKMFVAIAVLKLTEEGRLDLNAPVKSLVPDVAFTNKWEATDPVRVVHLLEHTTGWDDAHPKAIAHDDPRPVTLAEGLALDPDSRTSRWRPGTFFSYCNSGPPVAAAVVEKLTGKRFEDYLRDSFFDPIGMPTADYFYPERTGTLLTNLYHLDGRTPYPYGHDALRPSGALSASAREMGTYLRFLLRRGEADAGRPHDGLRPRQRCVAGPPPILVAGARRRARGRARKPFLSTRTRRRVLLRDQCPKRQSVRGHRPGADRVPHERSRRSRSPASGDVGAGVARRPRRLRRLVRDGDYALAEPGMAGALAWARAPDGPEGRPHRLPPV
jgi:CubicO group peptidase (beta-lactamase class C family)